MTVNCRTTLLDIIKAITQPIPKVLRPKSEEKWVLQSDASDLGWGGRLLKAGCEVDTVARAWTPTERMLHITQREALSSAFSVSEFMGQIPPGVILEVHSDSTPTVWTWRKGSRLRWMNSEVSRALIDVHKKGIFLQALHIPGKLNTRADWLSRNPDDHSYRLNPEIFQRVCRRFDVAPTIDLFANRFNKQVPRFCAWRRDTQSQGNAFQISWTKEICWLNPPWALLHQALNKLRQDQATALACVPVWRSAPWWSMVEQMADTPPWICKNTPMFQNPQGVWMPPPRLATAFVLLRGSGKS
jgi:hypothetical protein